ncbi:MAG: UvrD-helicase domain-containing protein [Gemmatimonadota bacterium]|nr:UvrD-helicase domain-containing protein [Gemmatimonadota bacterium]
MRFVADVHLHSRFSRATSRALNPENLYKWSALKGVNVVGTGDFTHPEWIEELKDRLEPAEEGLFRLRPDRQAAVDEELPERCRGTVRFVLSTEISLIYKKNEKTRKVHHVVLMPGFEAVERLNARLGDIGNLKSDGRPILGLDSRDLVEICLEASDNVLFIPAHIWTPHFAVLGASSGFDTLEECFEDMLPAIFAVETGLSSDPPMNWRLSMLDRYAIVSNSDAHSPPKLAREATCFDTDLSYGGIYDALNTRDPARFLGTLEFYPEEGKYHLDGHRNCGVCWQPAQSLAADCLCPECGKRLTVGVLHRVEQLADRAAGIRPPVARPYENLIPLTEVIGSVLGVGPTSKRVQAVYERMLVELGPELAILRDVSPEAMARCGEPLVAEGVRRMRSGEVVIAAGYDGEYGRIQVFSEEDRARLSRQPALFDLPEIPEAAPPAPAFEAASAHAGTPGGNGEAPAVAVSAGEVGLDDAQRAAVDRESGPSIVVAGPGTGKTRVLTHRLARLIGEAGVPPASILAVTFTNKAAAEMRERVHALLPGEGTLDGLTLGTFHAVALNLMKDCTSGELPQIIDEAESTQLVAEVIADVDAGMSVRDARLAVSFAKTNPDAEAPDALRGVWVAYRERLRKLGVWDFDDILLELLAMLQRGDAASERIRNRFSHVLVDEFQDVNAVQYQLVTALSGGGDGLFVIGDPDQAIYGFRGASPAYFEKLREDLPSARTIVLDRTYRSTPQITGAAVSVIGDGRELNAVRGEGVTARLLSTSGETAEGIAVVREISRMMGGADMLQAGEIAGRQSNRGEGDRSLSDFAVLFRTGRQAEAIERCFIEEGLPYRVVGQKGFLSAGNVRHAISFFNYAFRPPGFLHLLRALAVPNFHPGNATLSLLRRAGGDPSGCNLPPPAREKVSALEDAAETFREMAVTESVESLVRTWQEVAGAEEDEDLARLARMAVNFDTVRRFLDTLVLGADADYVRVGGVARPRAEAVTLSTLHASKGLEFPVVFICGVEEGLIPHENGDEQEERRLLFVGLTRAMDEAVMLCARSRTRFGERVRPQPSRFLEDIPAEYIKRERLSPERRVRQADQLSLF